MTENIIAYVAKTIVKITGFSVKGLKPSELEKHLAGRFGCPVRVIGVSGDEIKMDIYGLEPEAILNDAQGIIKALALVPGLTALEVAKIATAEKVRVLSAEELAGIKITGCAKESLVKF